MNATILKDPERPASQTFARSKNFGTDTRNNSPSHGAGLELANKTKDAWLIAYSQQLRQPLSAMGSMLGLIELGHKLARVRPLSEEPSGFDEAAFDHVRRNFQRLVHCFDELCHRTGQGTLQMDRSPLLSGDAGGLPPVSGVNATA